MATVHHLGGKKRAILLITIPGNEKKIAKPMKKLPMKQWEKSD